MRAFSMPDAMTSYELVLRGVAVGTLAATAIGVWRVAAGRSIALATLMLCIAAIAHVFENSPAFSSEIGSAYGLVNFFSLGATGFVWLFIVTLFQDDRIRPATLAPVGVLILIGLASYFTDARPIWFVHKVCEAGLALHALRLVLDTWRGDLVEARLRIRTPFVAIVALYALIMAGLQIAGLRLPARDLINAIALAGLSLTGAAIFLRAPADLLGVVPARPSARTPEDLADRAALARLGQVMGSEEVWRQEGLTIGALAERVGLPEHRLRALINEHLGFRNFPAYVNSHRIDAAKALLADPSAGRKTVSAIAYDLGFGSLGPFNRAFKEATGITPTEFRRTQVSPNPENPG